MEKSKNKILLDRAILISLTMNLEKIWTSEYLKTLIKFLSKYDSIIYEPQSMSAIEYKINSIDAFRDKLFSLDYQLNLELDPDDDKLLTKIIEISQTSFSVSKSIQQFNAKKGGSFRPHDEVLTYMFRMILLAKKFDADIFPWSHRLNIFLSLFEELRIEFKKSEVEEDIYSYSFLFHQIYLPLHTSSNEPEIVLNMIEIKDKKRDIDKSELKKLIAQNDLNTVFEILMKNVPEKSKYYNEIIHLKSSYDRVSEKERGGEFRETELDQIKNRVNFSLLNIIDSLFPG